MCEICRLENSAHQVQPSRRSLLRFLGAASAGLALPGIGSAKEVKTPPKPQNVRLFTTEAEARKAVQEVAPRHPDLVKIWVDDRADRVPAGTVKSMPPAISRAIIDEAEWYLTGDPDARTGFVENLAALSNHYERAMVTFLDHNQFWKGATRFYHADTLPYWRKRKNLPHRLAAVDTVVENSPA